MSQDETLAVLDQLEAGEAGLDGTVLIEPVPGFTPFAMAGLHSALFRAPPDESVATACPIVVGGSPADDAPAWNTQMAAVASPDARSVIVIGQMRPARPGELALQLAAADGKTLPRQEMVRLQSWASGVFANRIATDAAVAKVRLVNAEAPEQVVREIGLSAPVRANSPKALGFARGLDSFVQRLFDPAVRDPLDQATVLKLLRQAEDSEKLAVLAAHPVRIALVATAASDPRYGRWREALGVAQLEEIDIPGPVYPDAQLSWEIWEAWMLPSRLIDAVADTPGDAVAELAARWGEQRFQSWTRGAGDLGPMMPLADVLLALQKIARRARTAGMDVYVGWRGEA
jgi:hypothetical protein